MNEGKSKIFVQNAQIPHAVEGDMRDLRKEKPNDRRNVVRFAIRSWFADTFTIHPTQLQDLREV